MDKLSNTEPANLAGVYKEMAEADKEKKGGYEKK